MPELAPYPTGPMPTNDPPSIPASQRWTRKRWQVYVLLHSGYTTKTAAAEVGYHPASVERLRKDWKKRFGINIRATAPEECL
ncbi:MAG: helix-turn-helix domain-containing protein, partial [Acidimicrobiia bacterium]|nr:helix-turn-helix domain-containing protein [Acidimicrobiia bacterium]